MLTLISGQPGNGKTLRAMALMVEEYERNKAANALAQSDKKWERLRSFHSNIEGVSFDWHTPMEAGADWRELPDGAFVIYDEAHSDGNTVGLEHYGRLFPSTGKPGESDDPRIRAMSTARHFGKDLVFVTQWPSKLHHNVRQLVGQHIHMNRAMGLQRAGVLTWSRVQPDPYDERQREKAEEEIWAFPQDLFGRYKSATLHTSSHKFRMPKKVWELLFRIVVLLLVAWGLYWFVTKDVPAKAPPAAVGQAPAGAAGPLVPAFGLSSAAERVPLTREQYVQQFTPRVASMPYSAPAYDGRAVVADPKVYCILSGRGLDAQGVEREGGCRCITEQGTRYLMPFDECRVTVMSGGVYNPFQAPAEDRPGRRGGAGGAGGTPAVSGASSAAPAPEAVVGVASAEPVASYGGFRTGG